MKKIDIDIINDGEEIKNIDKYKELGILDYCNIYNKKATVGFVGVVIKKDKVVLSLPKKYELDKNVSSEEKIEILRKILNIFTSINVKSEGNVDVGENEQFPIKSYLELYGYYKRFGLYKSIEKYKESGFYGNVDWNRTINLKDKILQKNGIIFDSFIITKNRDVDVFLGECMDFVLSDASNYSDILDIVRKYRSLYSNKIFNNIDLVIKILNSMKNRYFKDIEKKLIQNIINYFNWKSSSKDNFRLLTLNFEIYWEKMVDIYLNKKFVGYENDSIKWGKNQKYKFKKKTEVVEKPIKRNKPWEIELDHFCETEDTVYIFDSKYYNDISSLNYKQLFYSYHIKSLEEFKNKKKINALLIPKSNNKNIIDLNEIDNIHIDRTNLDEVKIMEHYLDLDDVIETCIKGG